MIFAGGCAPRKGLHYALEAWLRSPAHETGTFLVAGTFVPGYAERLSPMLRHPSVRVLGHRSDLPALMRTCDALVLPSIEEGSALVTYEARGSGCVVLVSDAANSSATYAVRALCISSRRRRSLDGTHNDASQRSGASGEASLREHQHSSGDYLDGCRGKAAANISATDRDPQGGACDTA